MLKEKAIIIQLEVCILSTRLQKKKAAKVVTRFQVDNVDLYLKQSSFIYKFSLTKAIGLRVENKSLK